MSDTVVTLTETPVEVVKESAKAGLREALPLVVRFLNQPRIREALKAGGYDINVSELMRLQYDTQEAQ